MNTHHHTYRQDISDWWCRDCDTVTDYCTGDDETTEGTYLAIVNTPGYLPDTEPASFDTPQEAWEYLSDERTRHNDETEEGEDRDIIRQTLDPERTTVGTVILPTPGRDDDAHDLGIAYTVTLAGE